MGLDNPSCSYKTAWPVNISTKRKGLTFFSIHFFFSIYFGTFFQHPFLGLFFSFHFGSFFQHSCWIFFRIHFGTFFSFHFESFFQHPFWDFFQHPFWVFFSIHFGILQHPFCFFSASILGASILGLFSPNHGYNMTEQGPLKKDQVQP